jgi:uncharacterized protein (TIGR03083 family)
VAARRSGGAGLTVDRSDIEGLDALALYDAEAERCIAFLSGDPDWTAPTRCEGWNVRDLLSHFAGVETYHLACLDDAIGALFEEAGKDGVTGMDSFNDWIVRKRADRSSDEVMDEWRTKNLEVRRRMRERGPDGTMSSSVGPYPVDLMAFHIASEYATHFDDMGGELSETERAHQLAWRAKVSLFALKEAEKPVTVEPLERGYFIKSGEAKSVLQEDEFVEAVCARLPDNFSIDPGIREALRALA